MSTGNQGVGAGVGKVEEGRVREARVRADVQDHVISAHRAVDLLQVPIFNNDKVIQRNKIFCSNLVQNRWTRQLLGDKPSWNSLHTQFSFPHSAMAPVKRRINKCQKPTIES